MLTQKLPQRVKRVLQVMPHVPLVQVGVPFPVLGGGQVTQLGPQAVASVSLRQVPPHRWKPLLQTKLQLTPSHLAVPLGGAGQGVQLVPQVSTLVLLTQVPLHSCRPFGHRQVPLSQILPPVQESGPSTTPSQLLSWPSQTSVEGVTSPWHDPPQVPLALQVSVPRRQIPTPAVPSGPL